MDATMTNALLSVWILAWVASGCATESTTVRTMSEPPAEQTPAASYPIPKTDPKGTAYLMSLGRQSMASPSGGQAWYLHIRLAAENRSDENVWTVDAYDQVVDMGSGPARPTYALGSAGGSVVTLAQGQQGYLDLFYALPPAGAPAQATLSWQVRRGTESVSDSTAFQLQSGSAPEYVVYQPVGVAVTYWPAWWWGVGFYGPWWWGWGPYPYWGYWGYRHYHGGYRYGGYGYARPRGFHGGGFRGGGVGVSPPPPSRGLGGGRGRLPR